MRIDAHLHFWQPACNFDNRPIADHAFYRRDFMPADVRPALDACGIDGVVLVQTAPQTEETDWCIELARHDERILGVTAWVDLDGPLVDFDALAARPKVVGLRAQLRRVADTGFVTRPRVVANLAAALRAGLAVTILAEERHYGVVPGVLDALPTGPVIVNHLGLPFPQVDTDGWHAFLRRLAERPDTFAQFSGIPFCFAERWRESAARARMDDTLRILGPRRLLYASDWPMLLRFARYEAWFAAAWDYLAAQGTPAQDVPAIFGGNVLRAHPRLVLPAQSRAGRPPPNDARRFP